MTTFLNPNNPIDYRHYNTNVVGNVDGIVPIINFEGTWRFFSLFDLWDGRYGKGRYVPKVNDFAVNPITTELYRVTAIHPETLIPTLVLIKSINNINEMMTQEQKIVGIHLPADTSNRIYIDNTVIPHTMCVDIRYTIPGSLNGYAMIFKDGVDYDNPISRFYDNSGNLLGTHIPLELVDRGDFKNHTMKTIPICYTNEDIMDGEYLKIVIYNDEGQVNKILPVLAVNTGFVRKVDENIKYVDSITLDSPFKSPADDHVFNIPLNVLRSDLHFYGRVHYTDGSSLKLAVDGTKFQLFGLDIPVINNNTLFVSTQLGELYPLVLNYNLAKDESVYGLKLSTNNSITKEYEIHIIDSDGSYHVKLFGYPVWVRELKTYRFEWFLLNLNRDELSVVTDYVRFNKNTLFVGNAFNMKQNLSVSINLQKVNPAWKEYIHTQTYAVTLFGPPAEDEDTPWAIEFENNQQPQYGMSSAINVKVTGGMPVINLSLGAKTVNEWLEKTYYASKPIYDPGISDKPPLPSHFGLMNINGDTQYYRLDEFFKDITLKYRMFVGETVYIKFIRRLPSNDEVLSVCGFSTKSYNK